MVGFGEDPGDRPDSGTDRADRGTGRSGTEPSGPPEDDNDTSAGRDSPGGIDSPQFGGGDDGVVGPPEDDSDPNPGGRFGGGGGRTGGTGRDPTRTITERTDISAGAGSPGGIDAPDISGTTPVEAVGRTSLGIEPTSGDVSGTEAVVESFDPAAQVNRRIDTTEQPGLAARTIDVVTDGVREANPTASAAVSGLATSFRTESGLPIPGTDRTLPGGRDFDRARGALEGPASGFDSAVSAGVEAATLDPDDAPLELSDVPLRDPGETAAVATLGTEAGRAGARAGIERGIQSFNPAAAGQDAATFTEFGVRGADRVQGAEADEIQTGLDVGEAAGETAVEVGPEVAGAAVVDEPSRAFEAGATGATVAGLGAVGPSAAGAGARAGRRVAGDALDSSSARRLLDDERGQLEFGRSDGDDSTTIEIDEPDDFDPQRVTRAEVTRSRDTSVRRDTGTFSRSFDQSRPTASRRGGRGGDDPSRVPLADEPMIESRTFEGLPTQRTPEPDFSGLGTATRQADADVTIPRDPLDTRGGLGFGGATAESVATGVGVGGLLGGVGETARSADVGFAAGLGGGAPADTGLGVGTGSEQTPGADTDTTPMAGGDETPLELLNMRAATDVNARTGLGLRTGQLADVTAREGLRSAGRKEAATLGGGQTIGQPERGTPPGSPDTPGNPRPPRVPDIPNVPDEDPDEEELLFGEDRDDRTFASGLASGEEAAEDAFGDLSFRL